MFVTMLAAAIDPESGRLEFANAGHPAPLLRTPDRRVQELGEHGALPLGVEWIPRTQAPALEQTVPGFVDGAGSRRLILSTPGDVDATASVEVVTADGSFTPTGFEAIGYTVTDGGI